MPFILLKYSPISPQNNNLRVVLHGHVTEEVVMAIKQALLTLRQTDGELVFIPLLRVERGIWSFFTSVKSKHHPTILQKCFIEPISNLKWIEKSWFDHQKALYERQQALLSQLKQKDCIETFSPLPDAPPYVNFTELNLLKKADPLKTFAELIFIKATEELPLYRPFTGVVFGGNSEVVQPNPIGSMDILPDTKVPIINRDMVLFGAGWDARRSQVQSMITGGGNIDIDLNVFLINKYGDMLREPVSPKTQKANPCPGITMWPDNNSGVGEFHDDEKVLIEFNKLHPSVTSMLIVLSIHSGARDFRHIQNAYLRMVDCEKGLRELELWRYNMDIVASPEGHRTVALCRLTRANANADKNNDGRISMGEFNMYNTNWELLTTANYFMPSRIDRITVLPGDILTHINREKVKPCTFVGTNTFAFNMQVLKKSLLFNTCILTFSRPNRIVDAETAHLVQTNMERVGESFEVEFDPDGDSNCGIQFYEKGSSVCVRHVDQRKYNPKPENSYIRPISCLNPAPRPVAVKLYNFEAVVPATDRGGTTDVYINIGYKEPKKTATASAFSLRDYNRVKLVSSKPLRTKCPAVIKFDKSIAVQVPIEHTVGFVPRCSIEVRDKDTVGRDDDILIHNFDITWRFVTGNHERVVCHPTFVADIEDLKNNAGFSKQDVKLSFDAELVFKAEM